MSMAQRLSHIGQRLARSERLPTDVPVQVTDGDFADVSYSGGVFTITLPDDAPLNLGPNYGPDHDDYYTADRAILVNAPGAGVTRTVHVCVADLYPTVTADTVRGIVWSAADSPGGAVARTTASSDADSQETYCNLSTNEVAWFSVELENNGSWGFKNAPVSPANPLSRPPEAYWEYYRSVGAITRRLILNNCDDVTGAGAYVQLTAGTSGTVYIGRQNYNSAITLTTNNSGWVISRALATFTCDSGGYLTAFNPYTNHYEPTLAGDTNQIEVVTSVDFGLSSVTTATLTFSGGLYLDI